MHSVCLFVLVFFVLAPWYAHVLVAPVVFAALLPGPATIGTVEELTCLATWKDGNSRYLVGLVSHHHAISNEERYRCFVYEKLTPGNGKQIAIFCSSGWFFRV